ILGQRRQVLRPLSLGLHGVGRSRGAQGIRVSYCVKDVPTVSIHLDECGAETEWVLTAQAQGQVRLERKRSKRAIARRSIAREGREGRSSPAGRRRGIPRGEKPCL